MASTSASPVKGDEVFSDENQCQINSSTPHTTVSYTPTMNGPQISEVPPPPLYPTYEPNTRPERIVRGGFGQTPKQIFDKDDWRKYPHLPNEAYGLDTNAHYPKTSQTETQPVLEPEVEPESNLLGLGIDGLDLDGSFKVTGDEEASPKLFKGKTKGELLADKINFERPSWVQKPVGSCFPVLPPEDQKRDFIELIDQNKDGSGELEPCFKCGKKHIIPGSPLTLGDRDKCYSALPDWFPRTGYEGNPWDHFTMVLTELVRVTEIMNGNASYRDPALWDLHFHDRNRNWTTEWARRYGGWWKCRSDPNAPELERNCQKCHQFKPRDENNTIQVESTADKKRRLENWIEEKFQEQGERDKEVALAKLKIEGIPQYIGETVNMSQFMSQYKRLMDSRGLIWGGRSHFRLPKIDKPELDTYWREAPDLSKKEPFKNAVEPAKPTQPGYNIWREKIAPMPKESPKIRMERQSKVGGENQDV